VNIPLSERKIRKEKPIKKKRKREKEKEKRRKREKEKRKRNSSQCCILHVCQEFFICCEI
jgi:hypothetical protein